MKKRNYFIISICLLAVGFLSYTWSNNSLSSFFEIDVMAWAKPSEQKPGTTVWINERMSDVKTKTVKTTDTSLTLFSGSWKHQPTSEDDTLSAATVDGAIKTGVISVCYYRACLPKDNNECDHAEQWYYILYQNTMQFLCVPNIS